MKSKLKFHFLFFPLLILGLSPSNIFCQSELKTIDLDGVILHYVEKGLGAPIVFVHGHFSDYRFWKHQMEDFSKKYRAIFYSRRYSYPNEVPIDTTSDFLKTHVNDLIKFLEALDAGPVHLVGYSLGGTIALQTTIHRPELIKTLTLGEPPVYELLEEDSITTSIVNEFGGILRPAITMLLQNEDREGTRLFLGVVMDDPDYFERQTSEDQSMLIVNAFEMKTEFLLRDVVSEKLLLTCTGIQKLTVPTLLVGGGKSLVIFTRMLNKLEECLQNKEKVILPDITHELLREKPELFNKAVHEFLGKY